MATTSATDNETTIIKQQDCITSAGEKVTELATWVMLERVVLKLDDKNINLDGLCLNDKLMSYMQLLLKRQFSSILGLKSTLIGW